jgi:hypothetical protein
MPRRISPPTYPHISALKLVNRFRLNLVLIFKLIGRQANIISDHTDPNMTPTLHTTGIELYRLGEKPLIAQEILEYNIQYSAQYNCSCCLKRSSIPRTYT